MRIPSTATDSAVVLQAEERIVRFEAAMRRALDPAFRLRLRERFEREEAPSALGASQADLVYTPVSPCRVFDSRLSAQGPLVPGTPRDFLVAGTANFPDQGGLAGGCGVPLGPATSVVVNLAVVDPTGTGNLRAWAASDPPAPAPLAAVLNFGSLAALPALANAVVLPICDAAAGACTSDLRLQAGVSGVHIVGDVLGYFRAVDLHAEMLVGATGLGPFPITGDDLVVAVDPVVTPARLVDCAVTCSISVATAAPNASGSALLQSGATFTGGSGYGGVLMPVPLASSAGTSAVTQSTSIGFGASLEVRLGCHLSASGDFIGDTAQGTVAWVCR